MKKNFLSLCLTVALLSVSGLKADNYSFHLSINTADLPSLGAGNLYSLDFSLSKGSSLFSNTVQATGFVFTGGTATGSTTTIGTASGDFTTSITLNSASAQNNEISQAFTAGTSNIQFDVITSQNFNLGNTTDGLFITILDNTALPIYTTETSGQYLTTLDITSTNSITDVKTFSGDGTNTPATVTAIATVPEPSATALFVAGGLLALVAFRRREANA